MNASLQPADPEANKPPAAPGRDAAGLLALEVLHDIRDPLETLAHLVFLADAEADDAASVRNYMRLAREQITHLSHVATQTLGFTRASQHIRPVCLVQLAESALRIHQRTIESKKIHLVRSLPAELVAEVRGGQILQVISNLIANALDVLPEAGTLSIRLRRREGRAQIVVADNGHGIAPADRHRVFEPFFTTKDESGTGLGLSLSKAIVEDHNGRLSLRSSVREGRSGTAFRIDIPA